VDSSCGFTSTCVLTHISLQRRRRLLLPLTIGPGHESLRRAPHTMASSSLAVRHAHGRSPHAEYRAGARVPLPVDTQDLRRKQKRWQDGRLKFHTFNKRVMVYDERSNYIGDTHWREDTTFGEGEELQLERGGTLVEVGECVGKRDQDLSELVDKRVKERARESCRENLLLRLHLDLILHFIAPLKPHRALCSTNRSMLCSQIPGIMVEP
jgi:hypothetical protein